MEDFRTVLDAKPLEDCKTDLGIETLLKMNFMTKVSEPGENEAWVVEMFPEAIFVSCYRRRTDKFFIVDSELTRKSEVFIGLVQTVILGQQRKSQDIYSVAFTRMWARIISSIMNPTCLFIAVIS